MLDVIQNVWRWLYPAKTYGTAMSYTDAVQMTCALAVATGNARFIGISMYGGAVFQTEPTL